LLGGVGINAERVEVPRYFFHMEDGGAFRDREGTVLPDSHAARLEAAHVLGELLKEHPADVWRDDRFCVTVTDDTGLILFVIDAATLIGPAASNPGPS
jgi:hypothetical protein